MKIGIIVAMQKELDLLLPLVKDYKSRTVNDITLYEGQMGDNSLTIMQCGIGRIKPLSGR